MESFIGDVTLTRVNGGALRWQDMGQGKGNNNGQDKAAQPSV
ncbi:hypothetical protein [Duganella sp. CF517]|nr:hypothetical protein [Duganella sp. CF517]